MPPVAARSRVLVVGEALVDVVRDASGEVAHPGGSPLNVAVGLGRLGLDVTLHSRFGADRHGVAIARHLEASGVAVTPGTVTEAPTSVALATVGADGAARYDFSIDWDPAPLDAAAFDAQAGFGAIHAGSIAAALEPGARAVERMLGAARERMIVSFDPNIRPALMGDHATAAARTERLIALADLVKASDEDVAWLYPDAGVPEVLARWRALGPALVVVTAGADGARALGAGAAVHVPAGETVVVDTIGAGDSFMAGLIAALGDEGLLDAARRGDLAALDESAIRRVVGLASRCAAITVSRPGADPPTRRDLG